MGLIGNVQLCGEKIADSENLGNRADNLSTCRATVKYDYLVEK